MKLHIKAKMITLHAKMEILDEDENIVYEVESKTLSIHNKTYIKDKDGNEVAYIYKKPISMHDIHFVEMKNGVNFELSEELFHLMKDVINIEELGWQLQGNVTGHNYEIVDSNGRVIASTHRKWLSMHAIYYIDIMDEHQMDEIVAVIITLAHMINDKQAAAVATSTSIGEALEAEQSES